MFCEQCGAELAEGLAFCESCGHAAPREEPAPVAATPVEPDVGAPPPAAEPAPVAVAAATTAAPTARAGGGARFAWQPLALAIVGVLVIVAAIVSSL
jgi:hypothetical protein